jgi:ABC-2 type transport system ATP-binding protein
VEPGEVVGFLGPNGAGKTTALQLLSGLLFPTSGRALVAGFDPWQAGPLFKSRIALILGNKQQLIWDLPPEETFLLNRALYGLSDQDYRESRDHLVSLLELEEVLDKPVRQLSLGERIKCELAASLLQLPEILFLDEPTLGLDLTAQENIRSFLARYRDLYGATILLTSHYMADVTALAPRILMVNHGRLLYDGSLSRLSERLAPVRRIKLVLAEPPPDGVLDGYGTVLESRFPRVLLQVPKHRVAQASQRILADLRVLDLSIEEPPVEEVIRRAFAVEGEDRRDEGVP